VMASSAGLLSRNYILAKVPALGYLSYYHLIQFIMLHLDCKSKLLNNMKFVLNHFSLTNKIYP